MWTWSEKEDICERCGHLLREEKMLARGRRNKVLTDRPPNPFTDQHAGHVPVNVSQAATVRQVNPFAPTPESNRKINPMAAPAATRRIVNPFRK
jgi:hypothetical protein